MNNTFHNVETLVQRKGDSAMALEIATPPDAEFGTQWGIVLNVNLERTGVRMLINPADWEPLNVRAHDAHHHPEPHDHEQAMAPAPERQPPVDRHIECQECKWMGLESDLIDQPSDAYPGAKSWVYGCPHCWHAEFDIIGESREAA